jgi:transcriptional regulator with XRE-family HTH domain
VNENDRLKARGEFLTARRANLSPSALGFPDTSRRRTPGLRREEVAQLSGVSVTWYTWLEQGRDIQVSDQVLESIATALRLGLDERNHLFRLARKDVPGSLPSITETASPALQTVVDNMRTGPAWAIDHKWDILAWNQAACEVFGDFSKMPTEERNILRFVFTDEGLRQRLENWELFAHSMLATFRDSCSKYIGVSWFSRLVEDLQELSPEFRAWWTQYEVRSTPVKRIKLNHPQLGILDLNNVSFQVMNNPELRMCVYAAELESKTACKLQQLVSEQVEDGYLTV